MTPNTKASSDQKMIHTTFLCPKCFARKSSSRENSNFKVIVSDKRENKRHDSPGKMY
jgi:hypothetical protein